MQRFLWEESMQPAVILEIPDSEELWSCKMMLRLNHAMHFSKQKRKMVPPFCPHCYILYINCCPTNFSHKGRTGTVLREQSPFTVKLMFIIFEQC